MQRIKSARHAVLALAFLAACESSTDPSMESLAGTWSATTFTTTENGVTTNQISQDAFLGLTLTASGGVTGVLILPNDNVNESMAGSWTLNGNTVTFNQSADTFVRDMPFTLQGDGTLVGDATFGGVRIQITLTRLLAAA